MDMELILWILVGLFAFAVVIYVVLNMNKDKCPEDDDMTTPTPRNILAEVIKITATTMHWVIDFDGAIEEDLQETLNLTFLDANGATIKSVDTAFEVIGPGSLKIAAVSGIVPSDVQRIIIGY